MTGGSSEACVLAGRVMTFRGVLTKKGTDPRTGNPVYILKFYEDFKIEYH
jgi:glutamate/tyrosine decarboxylase-like PLP-dependent enzyme